jgi:hypothetical protein
MPHRTPAQSRSLAAATTSWSTLSELRPGASATALARLCAMDDPPVERRMAVWGGEIGQRHGRGYEYRLTASGLAGRSAAHA